MLSQRLMLTMDTTDMPDLMPMVTDHMDTQLMVTTERDLLKLSQRLMPTTATTDMPDLMPMDMPHTLMVLMDVSGDKLNATQLRVSAWLRLQNQDLSQNLQIVLLSNFLLSLV